MPRDENNFPFEVSSEQSSFAAAGFNPKRSESMLTMLGSPRRCCDGITRRETLKAGTLTALGGFGLPQFLQAHEAGHIGAGKAKSVILLYLLGGAATQDMWDLKPAAPQEIRGEFKPIDTNVAGIQISEHLPLTASWMHKIALVRSVNHKAGCHNCLPSYSGWELPLVDTHPHDTDPPSMGSVCEYLAEQRYFRNESPRLAEVDAAVPGTNPQGGNGTDDFPGYVYMPCWLGWGQAYRRGGPYAGFMGKKYDALTTICAPYWDNIGHEPRSGYPQIVRGASTLPGSVLQEGITIDRLSSRRTLLSQLDDEMRRSETQETSANFDRAQKKAFDILTSSRLRQCFDLTSEDPKVVERYGRTLFGNSALIARRLVENGVKFVNVTWDLFTGPPFAGPTRLIDDDAWDTHQRNFAILKENKLPGLDQTLSALLEDLERTGLLDETLIVVMSEMGRTPRVNARAGRDHWTFCYSALFAGGGIRGGTVYGVSDAQAAYVKLNPVSTADICATIYSSLGISPDFRVFDRVNRPVEIAHGGRAIREIMT